MHVISVIDVSSLYDKYEFFGLEIVQIITTLLPRKELTGITKCKAKGTISPIAGKDCILVNASAFNPCSLN